MSGALYQFGPFLFDAARGQLTRTGTRVDLPGRSGEVLAQLLASAGHVVSKDQLIAAAWDEVAVTDNSLEQAVSQLRRVLGAGPDGRPWIETVPRRGYRFTADVITRVARVPDDALDRMLAPYRAFIEGRAALETMEVEQVSAARGAFARALEAAPDHPSAHLGLAAACVMQFESTRADEVPDTAALDLAVHHAREACRLESDSGEAWATLGLALDRRGESDALAAAKHAVTLEPANWRHHFRLSSIAWGEGRLLAARRALALLPGFPLAHWMAATVYVARQAPAEAERELLAGVAGGRSSGSSTSSFHPVAVHWLLGLLALDAGDDERAMAAFDAEIAGGVGRHLYSRETVGNTWYAIGALRHRQGRHADAEAAFRRSLEHAPGHQMARAGLGRVSADSHQRVLANAARCVMAGRPDEAAAMVEAALDAAPAGSDLLWFLPVEPLLAVGKAPGTWAAALARVRTRAF